MSKPLNTELYIGNDVLHLNQVYTGFGILHHKGLLKIKIKRSTDQDFGTPFLKCIIEGKKIVFEMHDGIHYLAKEAYSWCDFYFKRSTTTALITNNPKIIPWGLNFYITSVHDFSFKRSLLKNDLKTAATTFFRSNFLLSKLFNIKSGAHTGSIKYFDNKPVLSKHPMIVFSPRLWEPERVEGYKKEDRLRLNNERIECVRNLKKYFPEYYNGGIENTAYALKVCPDLILPLHETHKKNYIKNLKQASIGIATPGLVESIGWKFSEYMIFSKAIVSNDISNYLLHAPVYHRTNYMAYTSPNNFLHFTEQLIKDEDLRFTMMQKNYEYTQRYLHPEKQLCTALSKAGFEF